MPSRIALVSLLLLGCAATLGCSEPQRDAHEISAGAATQASSDGPANTRAATASEQGELEAAIQKRKSVDAQFPASPVPWGAPGERVTDVAVPGVLTLAGGRRAQLDGIRCNEQGVDYLRRILQDDGVTVVVVPSAQGTAQPVPAEVWSADSDLQSKGISTSPAYSNVIETAITSAWCQVEATPSAKRNARYAALAQAFGNGRSAR